MTNIRRNNEGVAVDHAYYWLAMATCPLNTKVQLLNAGGVAVYGKFNGREDAEFWRGWAPLPKVRNEQ